MKFVLHPERASEDDQFEGTVIEAGDAVLPGLLACPQGALGSVIFVHGSGSSRLSPRNRAVAESFVEADLAVLLFDLLTTDENAVDRRTAEYRFDIPFLTERLIDVSEWAMRNPTINGLGFGYFGASTGAAAALTAAATSALPVKAIVSRGGRPDLAREALSQVRCPTLLIVGSRDAEVLRLNQRALASMKCERRLEVVPGATHLFEEPGTMEQVTRLSRQWFLSHIRLNGTEWSQ